MASMLGASIDVRSTRITLTTPKCGAEEQLYLDFQLFLERW
jgi:hypothetical protein